MNGIPRLLRTIRLDASDTVVFAEAAAPGEWAVPGTFVFAGRDPAHLSRKESIAFRTGFLGISSFAFSTLAVVSTLGPGDYDAAIDALAEALVARMGAPGLAQARPAAQEEIALAASLCADHAPNTLIALHRSAGEDGAIRERFRSLRPRAETVLGAGHLGGHDRAFSIVETDEADGEAGDEGGPEDAVDLVALLRSKRP